MKTVVIPIEEWLRLVESGVRTPATVIPRGSSMWPLIRGGKDAIEVRPVDHTKDINTQLKVGDVVVFRRADGAYVVHRIYRIEEIAKTVKGQMSNFAKTVKGQMSKNGEAAQQGEVRYMVQTYGDNCQRPDTPVPYEAVCGKVYKIFRGGRTIDPTSGAAMAIAKVNRSTLAKMRGELSRVKHSIKKEIP